MVLNDKTISLVFFRIIGAIISIFVFLSTVAHCQTVQGNALAFIDGDTIQFRQNNGKVYKVRLIGIDAPEIKQDFGRECKDLLKSRTFGKPLTLQVFDVDMYKRPLAKISTPTIADVNLFMLENGCAWSYSPPMALKTAYESAEATAQNNHAGLWENEFALPPWQFRRSVLNPCQ